MNVQLSIHIPSFLKVYDNALDDLGSILQNQGINRVVLYFGNDLIEMFGSKVMNSLKDAQVDVLEYKEIDTIALNDITQMAFSISPKAQAVIGIGGGKDADGNLLIVHCSGGANGVVITGSAGFTAVARPDCFTN